MLHRLLTFLLTRLLLALNIDCKQLVVRWRYTGVLLLRSLALRDRPISPHLTLKSLQVGSVRLHVPWTFLWSRGKTIALHIDTVTALVAAEPVVPGSPSLRGAKAALSVRSESEGVPLLAGTCRDFGRSRRRGDREKSKNVASSSPALSVAETSSRRSTEETQRDTNLPRDGSPSSLRWQHSHGAAEGCVARGTEPQSRRTFWRTDGSGDNKHLAVPVSSPSSASASSLSPAPSSAFAVVSSSLRPLGALAHRVMHSVLPESLDPFSPLFFSSLLVHILKRVSVHLTNVQVSLEDSWTTPESPFQCGLSLAALLFSSTHLSPRAVEAVTKGDAQTAGCRKAPKETQETGARAVHASRRSAGGLRANVEVENVVGGGDQNPRRYLVPTSPSAARDTERDEGRLSDSGLPCPSFLLPRSPTLTSSSLGCEIEDTLDVFSSDESVKPSPFPSPIASLSGVSFSAVVQTVHPLSPASRASLSEVPASGACRWRCFEGAEETQSGQETQRIKELNGCKRDGEAPNEETEREQQGQDWRRDISKKHDTHREGVTVGKQDGEGGDQTSRRWLLVRPSTGGSAHDEDALRDGGEAEAVTASSSSAFGAPQSRPIERQVSPMSDGVLEGADTDDISLAIFPLGQPGSGPLQNEPLQRAISDPELGGMERSAGEASSDVEAEHKAGDEAGPNQQEIRCIDARDQDQSRGQRERTDGRNHEGDSRDRASDVCWKGRETEDEKSDETHPKQQSSPQFLAVSRPRPTSAREGMQAPPLSPSTSAPLSSWLGFPSAATASSRGHVSPRSSAHPLSPSAPDVDRQSRSQRGLFEGLGKGDRSSLFPHFSAKEKSTDFVCLRQVLDVDGLRVFWRRGALPALGGAPPVSRAGSSCGCASRRGLFSPHSASASSLFSGEDKEADTLDSDTGEARERRESVGRQEEAGSEDEVDILKPAAFSVVTLTTITRNTSLQQGSGGVTRCRWHPPMQHVSATSHADLSPSQRLSAPHAPSFFHPCSRSDSAAHRDLQGTFASSIRTFFERGRPRTRDSSPSVVSPTLVPSATGEPLCSSSPGSSPTASSGSASPVAPAKLLSSARCVSFTRETGGASGSFSPPSPSAASLGSSASSSSGIAHTASFSFSQSRWEAVGERDEGEGSSRQGNDEGGRASAFGFSASPLTTQRMSRSREVPSGYPGDASFFSVPSSSSACASQSIFAVTASTSVDIPGIDIEVSREELVGFLRLHARLAADHRMQQRMQQRMQRRSPSVSPSPSSSPTAGCSRPAFLGSTSWTASCERAATGASDLSVSSSLSSLDSSLPPLPPRPRYLPAPLCPERSPRRSSLSSSRVDVSAASSAPLRPPPATLFAFLRQTFGRFRPRAGEVSGASTEAAGDERGNLEASNHVGRGVQDAKGEKTQFALSSLHFRVKNERTRIQLNWGETDNAPQGLQRKGKQTLERGRRGFSMAETEESHRSQHDKKNYALRFPAVLPSHSFSFQSPPLNPFFRQQRCSALHSVVTLARLDAEVHLVLAPVPLSSSSFTGSASASPRSRGTLDKGGSREREDSDGERLTGGKAKKFAESVDLAGRIRRVSVTSSRSENGISESHASFLARSGERHLASTPPAGSVPPRWRSSCRTSDLSSFGESHAGEMRGRPEAQAPGLRLHALCFSLAGFEAYDKSCGLHFSCVSLGSPNEAVQSLVFPGESLALEDEETLEVNREDRKDERAEREQSETVSSSSSFGASNKHATARASASRKDSCPTPFPDQGTFREMPESQDGKDENLREDGSVQGSSFPSAAPRFIQSQQALDSSSFPAQDATRSRLLSTVSPHCGILFSYHSPVCDGTVSTRRDCSLSGLEEATTSAAEETPPPLSLAPHSSSCSCSGKRPESTRDQHPSGQRCFTRSRDPPASVTSASAFASVSSSPSCPSSPLSCASREQRGHGNSGTNEGPRAALRSIAAICLGKRSDMGDPSEDGPEERTVYRSFNASQEQSFLRQGYSRYGADHPLSRAVLPSLPSSLPAFPCVTQASQASPASSEASADALFARCRLLSGVVDCRSLLRQKANLSAFFAELHSASRPCECVECSGEDPRFGNGETPGAAEPENHEATRDEAERGSCSQGHVTSHRASAANVDVAVGPVSLLLLSHRANPSVASSKDAGEPTRDRARDSEMASEDDQEEEAMENLLLCRQQNEDDARVAGVRLFLERLSLRGRVPLCLCFSCETGERSKTKFGLSDAGSTAVVSPQSIASSEITSRWWDHTQRGNAGTKAVGVDSLPPFRIFSCSPPGEAPFATSERPRRSSGSSDSQPRRGDCSRTAIDERFGTQRAGRWRSRRASVDEARDPETPNVETRRGSLPPRVARQLGGAREAERTERGDRQSTKATTRPSSRERRGSNAAQLETCPEIGENAGGARRSGGDHACTQAHAGCLGGTEVRPCRASPPFGASAVKPGVHLSLQRLSICVASDFFVSRSASPSRLDGESSVEGRFLGGRSEGERQEKEGREQSLPRACLASGNPRCTYEEVEPERLSLSPLRSVRCPSERQADREAGTAAERSRKRTRRGKSDATGEADGWELVRSNGVPYRTCRPLRSAPRCVNSAASRPRSWTPVVQPVSVCVASAWFPIFPFSSPGATARQTASNEKSPWRLPSSQVCCTSACASMIQTASKACQDDQGLAGGSGKTPKDLSRRSSSSNASGSGCEAAGSAGDREEEKRDRWLLSEGDEGHMMPSLLQIETWISPVALLFTRETYLVLLAFSSFSSPYSPALHQAVASPKTDTAGGLSDSESHSPAGHSPRSARQCSVCGSGRCESDSQDDERSRERLTGEQLRTIFLSERHPEAMAWNAGRRFLQAGRDMKEERETRRRGDRDEEVNQRREEQRNCEGRVVRCTATRRGEVKSVRQKVQERTSHRRQKDLNCVDSLADCEKRHNGIRLHKADQERTAETENRGRWKRLYSADLLDALGSNSESELCFFEPQECPPTFVSRSRDAAVPFASTGAEDTVKKDSPSTTAADSLLRRLNLLLAFRLEQLYLRYEHETAEQPGVLACDSSSLIVSPASPSSPVDSSGETSREAEQVHLSRSLVVRRERLEPFCRPRRSLPEWWRREQEDRFLQGEAATLHPFQLLHYALDLRGLVAVALFSPSSSPSAFSGSGDGTLTGEREGNERRTPSHFASCSSVDISRMLDSAERRPTKGVGEAHLAQQEPADEERKKQASETYACSLEDEQSRRRGQREAKRFLLLEACEAHLEGLHIFEHGWVQPEEDGRQRGYGDRDGVERGEIRYERSAECRRWRRPTAQVPGGLEESGAEGLWPTWPRVQQAESEELGVSLESARESGMGRARSASEWDETRLCGFFSSNEGMETQEAAKMALAGVSPAIKNALSPLFWRVAPAPLLVFARTPKEAEFEPERETDEGSTMEQEGEQTTKRRRTKTGCRDRDIDRAKSFFSCPSSSALHWTPVSAPSSPSSSSASSLDAVRPSAGSQRKTSCTQNAHVPRASSPQTLPSSSRSLRGERLASAFSEFPYSRAREHQARARSLWSTSSRVLSVLLSTSPLSGSVGDASTDNSKTFCGTSMDGKGRGVWQDTTSVLSLPGFRALPRLLPDSALPLTEAAPGAPCMENRPYSSFAMNDHSRRPSLSSEPPSVTVHSFPIPRVFSSSTDASFRSSAACSAPGQSFLSYVSPYDAEPGLRLEQEPPREEEKKANSHRSVSSGSRPQICRLSLSSSPFPGVLHFRYSRSESLPSVEASPASPRLASSSRSHPEPFAEPPGPTREDDGARTGETQNADAVLSSGHRHTSACTRLPRFAWSCRLQVNAANADICLSESSLKRLFFVVSCFRHHLAMQARSSSVDRLLESRSRFESTPNRLAPSRGSSECSPGTPTYPFFLRLFPPASPPWCICSGEKKGEAGGLPGSEEVDSVADTETRPALWREGKDGCVTVELSVLSLRCRCGQEVASGKRSDPRSFPASDDVLLSRFPASGAPPVEHHLLLLSRALASASASSASSQVRPGQREVDGASGGAGAPEAAREEEREQGPDREKKVAVTTEREPAQRETRQELSVAPAEESQTEATGEVAAHTSERGRHSVSPPRGGERIGDSAKASAHLRVLPFFSVTFSNTAVLSALHLAPVPVKRKVTGGPERGSHPHKRMGEDDCEDEEEIRGEEEEISGEEEREEETGMCLAVWTVKQWLFLGGGAKAIQVSEMCGLPRNVSSCSPSGRALPSGPSTLPCSHSAPFSVHRTDFNEAKRQDSRTRTPGSRRERSEILVYGYEGEGGSDANEETAGDCPESFGLWLALVTVDAHNATDRTIQGGDDEGEMSQERETKGKEANGVRDGDDEERPTHARCRDRHFKSASSRTKSPRSSGRAKRTESAVSPSFVRQRSPQAESPERSGTARCCAVHIAKVYARLGVSFLLRTIEMKPGVYWCADSVLVCLFVAVWWMYKLHLGTQKIASYFPSVESKDAESDLRVGCGSGRPGSDLGETETGAWGRRRGRRRADGTDTEDGGQCRRAAVKSRSERAFKRHTQASERARSAETEEKERRGRCGEVSGKEHHRRRGSFIGGRVDGIRRNAEPKERPDRIGTKHSEGRCQHGMKDEKLVAHRYVSQMPSSRHSPSASDRVYTPHYLESSPTSSFFSSRSASPSCLRQTGRSQMSRSDSSTPSSTHDEVHDGCISRSASFSSSSFSPSLSASLSPSFSQSSGVCAASSARSPLRGASCQGPSLGEDSDESVSLCSEPRKHRLALCMRRSVVSPPTPSSRNSRSSNPSLLFSEDQTGRSFCFALPRVEGVCVSTGSLFFSLDPDRVSSPSLELRCSRGVLALPLDPPRGWRDSENLDAVEGPRCRRPESPSHADEFLRMTFSPPAALFPSFCCVSRIRRRRRTGREENGPRETHALFDFSSIPLSLVDAAKAVHAGALFDKNPLKPRATPVRPSAASVSGVVSAPLRRDAGDGFTGASCRLSHSRTQTEKGKTPGPGRRLPAGEAEDNEERKGRSPKSTATLWPSGRLKSGACIPVILTPGRSFSREYGRQAQKASTFERRDSNRQRPASPFPTLLSLQPLSISVRSSPSSRPFFSAFPFREDPECGDLGEPLVFSDNLLILIPPLPPNRVGAHLGEIGASSPRLSASESRRREVAWTGDTRRGKGSPWRPKGMSPVETETAVSSSVECAGTPPPAEPLRLESDHTPRRPCLQFRFLASLPPTCQMSAEASSSRAPFVSSARLPAKGEESSCETDSDRSVLSNSNEAGREQRFVERKPPRERPLLSTVSPGMNAAGCRSSAMSGAPPRTSQRRHQDVFKVSTSQDLAPHSVSWVASLPPLSPRGSGLAASVSGKGLDWLTSWAAGCVETALETAKLIAGLPSTSASELLPATPSSSFSSAPVSPLSEASSPLLSPSSAPLSSLPSLSDTALRKSPGKELREKIQKWWQEPAPFDLRFSVQRPALYVLGREEMFDRTALKLMRRVADEVDASRRCSTEENQADERRGARREEPRLNRESGTERERHSQGRSRLDEGERSRRRQRASRQNDTEDEAQSLTHESEGMPATFQLKNRGTHETKDQSMRGKRLVHRSRSSLIKHENVTCACPFVSATADHVDVFVGYTKAFVSSVQSKCRDARVFVGARPSVQSQLRSLLASVRRGGDEEARKDGEGTAAKQRTAKGRHGETATLDEKAETADVEMDERSRRSQEEGWGREARTCRSESTTRRTERRFAFEPTLEACPIAPPFLFIYQIFCGTPKSTISPATAALLLPFRFPRLPSQLHSGPPHSRRTSSSASLEAEDAFMFSLSVVEVCSASASSLSPCLSPSSSAEFSSSASGRDVPPPCVSGGSDASSGLPRVFPCRYRGNGSDGEQVTLKPENKGRRTFRSRASSSPFVAEAGHPREQHDSSSENQRSEADEDADSRPSFSPTSSTVSHFEATVLAVLPEAFVVVPLWLLSDLQSLGHSFSLSLARCAAVWERVQRRIREADSLGGADPSASHSPFDSDCQPFCVSLSPSEQCPKDCEDFGVCDLHGRQAQSSECRAGRCTVNYPESESASQRSHNGFSAPLPSPIPSSAEPPPSLPFSSSDAPPPLYPPPFPSSPSVPVPAFPLFFSSPLPQHVALWGARHPPRKSFEFSRGSPDPRPSFSVPVSSSPWASPRAGTRHFPLGPETAGEAQTTRVGRRTSTGKPRSSCRFACSFKVNSLSFWVTNSPVSAVVGEAAGEGAEAGRELERCRDPEERLWRLLRETLQTHSRPKAEMGRRLGSPRPPLLSRYASVSSTSPSSLSLASSFCGEFANTSERLRRRRRPSTSNDGQVMSSRLRGERLRGHASGLVFSASSSSAVSDHSSSSEMEMRSRRTR
ncbi:hypothetical protein TGRUB_248510A, partial [Toxoplasma gondii RUB]